MPASQKPRLGERILTTALLAAALLMPAIVLAETRSELHIGQDGKLVAKNLVVVQKNENGTGFFVRATWGEVYVRLTVLSTPNGVAAPITKNNGGQATYKEVQVGDLLNVEGSLQPGADTLLIQASKIKDLSLNVESKQVSGTIKTLNKELNQLTLIDKKLGTITVIPPSQIQKGARTIGVGELAVGDKVLSALGNYDYTSKIFTATSMEAYQDKSLFKEQNFQGTLKSIGGTALPVSLVVTVGSKDYTVYLPATASVMSTNKAPTSLARFTVGDRVRLFGSVRPTNLGEIDASVLRNLNF